MCVSTENAGAEGSKSSSKSKKGTGKSANHASTADVLSFVSTPKAKALFVLGSIGGAVNGLVYPALAYIFADAFSELSDDSMNSVKKVSMTFLVIGAVAFVAAAVQNICFELVSTIATRNFRLAWFKALLRQDSAFFDVRYEASGLASTIEPNSRKISFGLGKKFGEGIQFFVTTVAGIAYAFYASWRVAIIVIAVLPFVGLSGYWVTQVNQDKSNAANKSYAKAGTVAYQTLSQLRTILALNAVPRMIERYAEATSEAKLQAEKLLIKVGLANGSMLGTFISLYGILTLYGTYLLYKGVRDDGCDPSDSVSNGVSCENTGADVFSTMLGIAFAGQGMSQFANSLSAFTEARVACYPAMQAIKRVVGSELGEEQAIIIEKQKQDDIDGDLTLSKDDIIKYDEEIADKSKVILPKYQIDSSSPLGLKPKITDGSIKFSNVTFAYPTRPNNPVFRNFNIDISAKSTIALVGPSGGGKSTTVALLERFYDITSGSITIDGIDIKDMNVNHLRDQIGLVGQEPSLFSTTIEANIANGNHNATKEAIEEVARLANAHDFISSFPEGYQTQVGSNGAQLSGGQKQRIAIARALLKNPKILLLDEATSALDSESELVVQEALDKLLATGRCTTIVISHRLSTIRKAEMIAVVSDGKVEEIGSHDELMKSEIGHYRSLVEKQTESNDEMQSRQSSKSLVSLNSNSSLRNLDVSNETSSTGVIEQIKFENVTFCYPTRQTKNIFENFSLSIHQGESLALVGPSGQGKSTIASLIERFYDPTLGSVSFNGVNIKELNVNWLRDQIGYVGQEPVLFGGTIRCNIAYGLPNASLSQIEQAAMDACAHDFIKAFPEGYDTQVGEEGTQLSGGQKQRIAIARALIKRPKVLILDEATSALDSNSEAVVQRALDKIMSSSTSTTIVIAHRLSTIRNCDRIAFIGEGKVKESGTHDTLMMKSKGHYNRFVTSQHRSSVIDMDTLKKLTAGDKEEKNDEEEEENLSVMTETVENESADVAKKQFKTLAFQDKKYFFIGGFGALLAGGVFPVWGVLFGLMIDLLFTPILRCDDADSQNQVGFSSCQKYWDHEADRMENRSFVLAGCWGALVVAVMLGNSLTFWGFGKAAEALNKRLRDLTFKSLCRQDVSFYDKHPVGSITLQLQADVAKIHSLFGQPICILIINLSSVVTGLVISLIFMWPFALVAMVTIPLMGLATAIQMKQMVGEDLGADEEENEDSSGGIIVQTLMNMRTINAFNLERHVFEDYLELHDKEQGDTFWRSVKSGSASGYSMLIQQWVNALYFYWGGWLIHEYPKLYNFQDFVIAQFALLFALFALGGSSVGAIDKKEADDSAKRIFHLVNHKCDIDPLSGSGKKLD